MVGFTKWLSKLYQNQGSLIFSPPRFDWGEQIVLITGGKATAYPVSAESYPLKVPLELESYWPTHSPFGT
jgi:hypothetical protein